MTALERLAGWLSDVFAALNPMMRGIYLTEWLGVALLVVGALLMITLTLRALLDGPGRVGLAGAGLAIGVLGVVAWLLLRPDFGIWCWLSAGLALFGVLILAGSCYARGRYLNGEARNVGASMLASVLTGGPATLVLVAVIALSFIGTSPEEGQRRTVERQIDLVHQRLEKDIPEFRERLTSQADEVKRNLMRGIAESHEVLLHSEMQEIARALLALDVLEEECKATLFELASAQRQLERCRDAKVFIGDEREEFLERIAGKTRDASAKLAVSLDAHIGAGAIGDSQIQLKVAELFGESPPEATMESPSQIQCVPSSEVPTSQAAP